MSSSSSIKPLSSERRFASRVSSICLVVLLATLIVGCSDDEGRGSFDLGVDASSRDATLRADQRGHDARSAACVAQDHKLQLALDKARTSPNALLVVRNAACGTSVYISGDATTATADSLWRVGSVTKTYVAATILTLIRDKKLSLDDPLSGWVADVPNTQGVTVKMLLNHTSGIFNVTDDSTIWDKPLESKTPAQLVTLATSHAPYFAPGAGWHYSNTNYILLGMIAEKAGGAPLAELIRQRLLTPARLKQTFLEGEEPLVGVLASGFDQNDNLVTNAYHMSIPWAAGAMVASGADLCDWIYTLLGTEEVLSKAERAKMLETVSTSSSMRYGLGIAVLPASVTAGAGEGQGHTGGIFGYHTQAFFFPAKDTAICAVVNKDGADVNAISLATLQALF